MAEPHLLVPDWPAPGNIGALVSTRIGGCSQAPWDGFNLATHVGDDPRAVRANRRRLLARAGLSREPVWLNQVHGTRVIACEAAIAEGAGGADGESALAEADASVCRTAGLACAILTADCLPVLFCSLQGNEVAAAHAGWRGLAAGVLRKTLAAMQTPPATVLAYLGPAIGRDYFEVGPEVRAAFLRGAVNIRHREAIADCFRASLAGDDRNFADLYGLARAELKALGVTRIYGGGDCTWRDEKRFYSYRRDGVTGRMASMVWFWR